MANNSVSSAAESSRLSDEGCRRHQGRTLDMFCGKHDIICCQMCVQSKHK